jgi:hypothetical protein
MMQRPWRLAVARVVHGAFFVGVSTYALLSFSPFAYVQFIAPSVLPELTDFIALSPWLFWLVLLLTTLTLMPQLRGAKGAAAARLHVGIWTAVSIWFGWSRPLASIGSGRAAFVMGLAALLPPVSLALVDHVSFDAPDVRPVDEGRLFEVSLWSSLAAWAIYAALVAVRLSQVVGIDGDPRMIAMGSLWSALFDACVFLALFLVLLAACRIAALAGRAGAATYWLTVAVLAAAASFVLYMLVCRSLVFAGRGALMSSAALGTTLAIIWADVVRVRLADRARSSVDALRAFSAAITGGSRVQAIVALTFAPAIAYALAHTIPQFDWNFLLQKLAVLIVWLVVFCAVGTLVPERRSTVGRRIAVAIVPIAVFAASVALTPAEGAVEAGLDRYAAVNPSFRVIRDARIARPEETARYYAFLQRNSLLLASGLHPSPLVFAEPTVRTARARPPVFLFVLDSVRRDYLSPYNAKVTFTPEIAKFAAESFVFERAFTRYSGTGLSVPAIWSGGMVAHAVVQPAFERRNTLGTLIDGLGYQRFMVMDSVVSEVMPLRAPDVQLERNKKNVDLDVCDLVAELDQRLPAADAAQPVFVYALPQNIHIAVASRRKVPDGESYPGFFAPVASSLGRADECLGRFFESLKRSGLYDRSIIIITSDHGDSLGEEGRWGHAYFLYPEVMRVPLIIHLPAALKERVTTDLTAVSFLSDISPTLYALLGFDPPDLGPLYGRPLFAPLDRDVPPRRGPFLVASSYGPVYGLVRDNGRELYVVDTVDSRELAFDLSRPGTGARVAFSADLTATARLRIAEQIAALNASFGVVPDPPEAER